MDAPANQRSHAEPPAANDVMPLESLSSFETYDSIPYLMGRATDLAAGAKPAVAVSPSLLFFALTEAIDTEGRWTAHVIREFIDSHSSNYAATRDEFFASKGVPGIQSKAKRKVSEHSMKRSVHALLESAQSIAERTTNSRRIHARHLAGALLQNTPGNSGVFLHLSEMQVDPVALRGALFDYVCGAGDVDAAWAECLLEAAPAVRRIGGFATDRAGGKDLLEIEPDVHALSALIAARTVEPPLSIGLFGEWGSGKTFFMRELRNKIADISQEMKDEKRMQRELPFYKNIVQIEFNAWHYVEGNLWASLVEHILDNLYPKANPLSRQLQENLINQLAKENTLEHASSTAVDSAKAAADEAAKELGAAKAALDLKTKELATLNAAQVGRDFELTKASEPIKVALDQLGITAVGKSAVELEGALRQVHAVLGRGQSLLTPLTRGIGHERRFMWLILSLLGAPAVSLLVRVVLQRVDGANVYAALTGLAAFIGSIVPWLKAQAQWMTERLDEAEAAQKAFDQEMAQQSARHVADVTEAEQKLRELTAALQAALAKHAEAKGRQASAAAELKAATTGRLLANFITDRAASSDYRRHLGVLALVRDDFEKLSGLIEEENWKLAPPEPSDADRPESWAKRFMTFEEEESDKDQRINRIVLYIDDLDRCPPNKVVEVLQAVHLLLAFPLFVVVVGVDARWVTRSLQTKYRELLLVGNRAVEKEDEAGLMTGSATPNDYLEKIFQIPFWLKPMDAAASNRLVRGALRPGADQGPEVRVAAGPIPVVPPRADGGEAPPPTSANGDPANQPAGTGPASGSANPLPIEPRRGAIPKGQAVKLGLESLAITDAELDFISLLSSVLGRSPRALKRFANVYRLIKVGLAPHEHRAFLLARTPIGQYQAVLFLLAIDSSAPMLARAFFAAVEQGATLSGLEEKEGKKSANLQWVIRHLDTLEDKKQMADPESWQRLKGWLVTNSAVPPDTELWALSPWVRKVGRYSFEVGRA